MTRAPLVSPLAPRSGFPKLAPVKGFLFASVATGIKYSDRDDVMLVVTQSDAVISGVFTKSSTRSAAVLDCEAKLSPRKAPLAILVNSGNANAFTGAQGVHAVEALSKAVSRVTGVNAGRVFTASTGVIGEILPHDKIGGALEALSQKLTPGGMEGAARAIMTTDTFAKGASRVIETDAGPITISGFAKGSGMIAPDMATMLAFIFTDAKIEAARLQALITKACERSFNAITVDGDTSTSDTLIIASSCLGPKMDRAMEAAFEEGLLSTMQDLAHQIVKDGEGASKFIEISVTGAKSDPDAQKIAFSIANSPLVKTAIAGEDPNWGRIIMAIGKSGAFADRDKIKIWFGDIPVAEKGWRAEDYSEETAAKYMKNQELCIKVDLGLGEGDAQVWTCDLTAQYIAINADYRS